MSRIPAAWAVLLLLTAGTASVTTAGPPGADRECDGREPHEPIVVRQNHGPLGFNWTDPRTGEDEHRPGSGVVAGNGTEANPYVIAGWCLRARIQAPGIGISDTTAHVVVRDNTVVGPPEGSAEDRIHVPKTSLADVTGIDLADTRNVEVAANTLVSLDRGLDTFRARKTTAHGNLVTDSGTAILLHFSDGNTVTGNNLTGNHQGVLVWQDSDDNVVRGNDVTNQSGTGIFLVDRPGHNLVVGNDLEENRFGILVGGGGHNRIEGNTIHDNHQDGISVAGSSSNAIVNNTLVGNASVGIEVRDQAPNNTVRNNTVVGTVAPGIAVDASEGNTLEGNRVEDSGFAGIILFDADRTVVTGNDLVGNRAGAWVHRSDNNTLRDNEIADSYGGAGIELKKRSSENNTVAGNLLTGGRAGVALSDAGPGNTVTGNRIVDNAGPGVGLSGADGNRIRANTLAENTEGVRFGSSSSSNLLAGNLIRDSEGAGVVFGSDETGNAVVNNTLLRNEVGVAAWGPGNPVRNNTIRDSRDAGVHMRDVDGEAPATGNTIVGSGGHGVEIWFSSGPEIRHNNVSDNGGTGIWMRGSANVTITSNVLGGNLHGVVMYESEGHQVHRNNIEGNAETGLTSHDLDAPVNATRNWWGCPDGPSDSGCDDVDGFVAYNPWLTESNPDAGPD